MEGGGGGEGDVGGRRDEELQLHDRKKAGSVKGNTVDHVLDLSLVSMLLDWLAPPSCDVMEKW